MFSLYLPKAYLPLEEGLLINVAWFLVCVEDIVTRVTTHPSNAPPYLESEARCKTCTKLS